MGSYDCYCAICGGPLYKHIRLGKSSGKFLAARKKRVARDRRRLTGEILPESEDEASDMEMKDEDPNVCKCEGSCTCLAQSDESGSMDEWDEEHSYDPELVSEQETKWLGEARAIGFNPNAEGISKAFVSGSGTYEDYGDFHVGGVTIDSNDPEYEPYPCFYSWNTNRIPVFPFHEACAKMLRVAIFRHDEERPNLEASAFEGVSDIKGEGNNSPNWDNEHHDDDNSDDNVGSEDEDPNLGHEGGSDGDNGDDGGSDNGDDDGNDDDDNSGGSGDEDGSVGTVEEANEVNEDYGGNKIDKDLLYSVMTQLANGFRSNLDVDYGNIDGAGQSWECLSGEEFSVYNPIIDRKLDGTLRKLLANTNLTHTPSTLKLEAKVRRDPFARLPQDILYMILPYLSIKATLALMQASWQVNIAALDNSLWKRLIRINILPWFWELEDIFDNLDEETDFKMLYLWLNDATEDKFGMDGPLMAIANRRRIWHVCDVIRKRYWKLDEEETTRWKGCEGEAYEIMDSAISTQLPMAMYPKPPGTKMITSQWIRSWAEIDSHDEVMVFASYWSTDGNLVGFAVSFGSDHRRLLGKDADGEPGIMKKAIAASTRGWISGIILHICNVDSSPKMEPKAAIKALTISLTSGETLNLGDMAPNLNHRALLVRPGMHLVGLIAEVAVVPKHGSKHLITQNRIQFPHYYNDVITRLGILQAANPTEGIAVDFDTYELPREQRLLWHPSTAKIRCSPNNTDPIWAHTMDSNNVLRMISYEYGETYDELPLEILPHQALVWANNISELTQVRRISAFVLNDGTVNKSSNDDRRRAVYGIHGLRVTYQNEYAAPRTIGCGILPPGYNGDEYSLQASPAEWDDVHLQHFDIDGPGGEYVTSIHIPEDCKAIKLRTNRKRECYWGEQDRSNWAVQQVLERSHIELPRDGFLAGIVVVFGRRSCWSARTESGEWLKSSAATALFVGNEAISQRDHT